MAALIDVPPIADEVGRRFAANGHRLYLVGGSVRDALLQRASEDLDFCTDAPPEQILALLDGWAEATWTTGIAFGTVGAARAGHRLEITTFRADRYDRIGRNPIVSFGDSLETDLYRRDFTINAMALAVPEREFADPYRGMADLSQGVICTPAPAEESFSDDPLRMLRAARFVSQLRFRVADDVVAAMTKLAGELARITAERIRDEFSKLLLGADPVAGLRLLVATGLAEFVVPELPALRLAIDEHHQHKDVYEHTLTVLQQAIDREDSAPDLTLRLAALLHDVGKPATRRLEPGGGVSFHHHEAVGAKLARRRLRTLRYPKDIVADVSQLVFLHLRFYGYRQGEWTDSAVRRYVTDAGPLLPRLHRLVRSDSTTRNKRRAAALEAAYDALEARIERIAAAEDLARVRPDLDGNEIMRLLQVPAGPVVGRAWKFLKELRLERGPLDRTDAEAELLAWARREGIVS